MGNQFLPNHPLSFNEILLIPEALYQLLAARLKVSLLKSEQYLPPPQPKIVPAKSAGNKNKVQIIAKLINGLSVRVPWPATCMVKVIAAHKMLLKRDIPHVLHFGVQKNAMAEIKAHAWLSTGSKIIVGGENLDGYNEISQIVS